MTYLLSVGFATAVSVLGWLACVLIPHLVLQLFGTDNAAFTTFAVRAMRIFMAAVFLSGFQIVTTNYFQATGQPLKASVLSLMRQIIFLIPLILILPLFLGLDGVLYAGMIADLGSSVVVAGYVLHEMRRLKRWINGEISVGDFSASGRPKRETKPPVSET